MPTNPYVLTFNLSNLPAQLQTFVTNLDTSISTGWFVADRTRTVIFQWANYGGFTQAKLDIIKDQVLPFYRSLGWSQANLIRATGFTNNTQFAIIFERPF